MKRNSYRDVYDTIFGQVSDWRAHRVEWARNLLALGPFAEWADPEDIESAIRSRAYEPQTDAGALFQGVVWEEDPDGVLLFAGKLDGGENSDRSMEVLLASALAPLVRRSVQDADIYPLAALALALNKKRAIEMIRGAMLSEDWYSPDGVTWTIRNAMMMLDVTARGSREWDLQRVQDEADNIIESLSEDGWSTLFAELQELIAEEIGS